jgi:hypothetical protein
VELGLGSEPSVSAPICSGGQVGAASYGIGVMSSTAGLRSEADVGDTGCAAEPGSWKWRQHGCI